MLDGITVAVILYIGILLMAATVAGLTIIYFVKPRAGTERVTAGDEEKEKQFPEVKPAAFQIGQAPPRRKIFKLSEIRLPKFAKKSNTVEASGDKNESPKAGAAVKKERATRQETATPTVNTGTVPKKEPANVKPELPKQEPVKASVPGKATTPLSQNPLTSVPAATAAKPSAAVSTPVPAAGKVATEKPGTVFKTVPEAAKQPVKVEAAKSVTPLATLKAATPAEPLKPASSAASTSADKKTEQKTSLDDLSKMFSREMGDDSEATKLAKDMKDVEIGDLLKDSRDLITLLKRTRN